MATLEDSFRQVLADFKTRLKPGEEAQFAFTTLNDLQVAAKDLQEEQRKSKTAQNLTRIQPFLQAMGQYKEIIEVFLNTSSMLCFVWGPMKFMLLIASNWNKSFDILLDAYKQIAEHFPLLLQYRSMFAENDHLKKVLVWIYEDVLKFHLRAWRVFAQPAWKQLFHSTWKDFQESFKPILSDLVRHRELLESGANVVQMQEFRDSRLQSQASFSTLEREQNRTKTLAVINWLSAADASLDQEAFTATRQDIPDTGSWILKELKVKDWLDPTECSIPVFWLNGIPGAGKTVLASVVIDEALKVSQSHPDISVIFFYCKDQDGQRNTFPSVAKAMLAQLLAQNPPIVPYLYDQCLKSGRVTLSSPRECSKILGTLLQVVTKTFIIIDGIDECEEKERKGILNFFTSIIDDKDLEPGKLRGFFLSQELSDIKSSLRMAEILQLTEEHSKLDIEKYAVKWSLRIQQRFARMPNSAKDHIVRLVCEGAEGMFLFARLVLENLFDQENLEDLYHELHPDKFPNGFDQAYARIVNRIYNNPSISRQKTARKLIGWITFAKRPLKLQEIQGATSIDIDRGLVNFEGRQLPDHMRDICGSLVEILPGDRVQLVHKTARHYLIASKHADAQKEERQLALLCMRYLTFECFGSDLSYDDMLQYLEDGSYSFLDYASLHWNHHLETALDSLKCEDLSHSAELGIALNEFFEMYEPEMNNDKTYKEMAKRCAEFETAQCYECLVILLSHARVSRATEEQLEALGPLGAIIIKVRKILAELGSSLTLDPSLKKRLTQFYGENWYKCSRLACFYFHEGFTNDKGLLQHTNRHEKPFCCTEMGCTRMYIGWSTEKELKKHMSQYHPDPEAFSWKFPHVKKPPATFQCNLCPKRFTRANTLHTHQMREHKNERPFACKICSKRFVRKYECDRHESIHQSPDKNTESPDTSGAGIILTSTNTL